MLASSKDLCLDIYESNEEKGGTLNKFQCRKVKRWDKEISFVEVTEGYKTLCKSLVNKNLCGSPVK